MSGGIGLTLAAPIVSVYRTTNSATITSDNSVNTDDVLTTSALLPSTAYELSALLLFAAANATMDLKVAWSVPSGCTMSWGIVGSAGNGGSWNLPGTGASPAAFLTEASTLTGGSFAGSFGVLVSGFVLMGSSAGAFAVQWAQATSDPGTLGILAGSFLRFTRLG